MFESVARLLRADVTARSHLLQWITRLADPRAQLLGLCLATLMTIHCSACAIETA